MSIIIIRHAEKPSVGSDLSKDGITRAKELHNYLLKAELLKDNMKLDLIIAMKQHKDHSNRPYQTVMYLAEHLGLKIHNDYERDEIDKLIKFLSEHKEKNIVICWEHNRIVDIIRNLTDITIEWKGSDYSSVYIIKDKSISKLRQFEIVEHTIDYSNAVLQ